LLAVSRLKFSLIMGQAYIYQREELPLTYSFSKFMIILGSGLICYTKGDVALDLMLANGMSSEMQLQDIDTEVIYDILLGMDFI